MANQRRRLIQIFKDIDTNKDAKISFDELKMIMQNSGFTDEDIENTMRKVDMNCDGSIDIPEFLSHFSELES